MSSPPQTWPHAMLFNKGRVLVEFSRGWGGVIMQVSKSEAAQIYARACTAWYGAKALKIAHGSIQRCKQQGDIDGAALWAEIATAISLLKPTVRRAGNATGRLY